MLVVNKTIEIELAGIKIAAITGDKLPDTAYKSPMMLYNREIIKLPIIMLRVIFEKSRKNFKSLKREPSKIASHAGEKLFISSEIEIPISLW